MEKKLTAVDFLLDNMHYYLSTKWKDIIEQAEEMEKKQQGYSEEDMREPIVKSALSNIDNMIERCDKIIEQFKKK